MTESNHLIAKSFLAAGPIFLAVAGAHQIADASTITIQSGDTLSALAAKHKSTVNELSRSNNILNPDLIFAGASLTIPDAPVEATQTDLNLQEYTVQAGDSLSIIADRFGTSVQEIAQNSNIDANDVIRPGQVVKLKATATTAMTTASVNDQKPATDNEAAPAEQTTEQPSQAAQVAPEPSQTTQVDNTTEQASDTQTASQTESEQASPATTTNQSEQPVAPADNSSNQPTVQENPTAVTPTESTTGTTVTPAPSEETTQAQPVAQPVQTESEKQAPAASGDWRSVAESLIGTPYVWGGKTPESGLDCSGFVAWVLNHSGRTSNFPTYTVAEEAQVQQISVDDAQPGDLLFWGDHGATYHVAIYLGNGQFIAAPEPGDHVRVQNLSRGWRPSFAGRV